MALGPREVSGDISRGNWWLWKRAPEKRSHHPPKGGGVFRSVLAAALATLPLAATWRPRAKYASTDIADAEHSRTKSIGEKEKWKSKMNALTLQSECASAQRKLGEKETQTRTDSNTSKPRHMQKCKQTHRTPLQQKHHCKQTQTKHAPNLKRL